MIQIRETYMHLKIIIGKIRKTFNEKYIFVKKKKYIFKGRLIQVMKDWIWVHLVLSIPFQSNLAYKNKLLKDYFIVNFENQILI